MKKIFSKSYSSWNDNKFEYLIKTFNLPLNQKISNLSKGMKIQFSLALALSHNAELLIMDEPTSGLDPLVRSQLINIFKKLAENGIGILFSTHITSDLEKVANDIILIDNGNILFQKNVSELRNTHFVINDSIDKLDNSTRNIFLKITENGNSFEGIYSGCKEKIYGNFPSGKIRKANIEDIMIGYIGGKK